MDARVGSGVGCSGHEAPEPRAGTASPSLRFDNNSPTRIDISDVLAVDDAVARSTGYGLIGSICIPKPFARLLAEKLALHCRVQK